MTKANVIRSFMVALGGILLIAAMTDQALTSTEMRALSAGQANRQIQRDLLSILRPTGKAPGGMTRMIGDVWIHTKASATDYEPLCQRDTLSLFYAPTSLVEDHEDRPVRPYKIETERTYRFIAQPKQEHLDALNRDDHFRSPFDPKCKAADGSIDNNEWAGWFTAESPDRAMTGGFAVLAVLEWAKHPDHRFQSCSKEPVSATCQSYGIAELKLDAIGDVAECAPDKAGEICLQLGKWGILWTIRAKDTRARMQAADIVSVDYEMQIIVT
jgi:hypothetical protein